MADFSYTIKRSARRRKVTIVVERDKRVVVHAPQHVSESELHRLVAAKREWILAKISHSQKYVDLPHPPGKELVNGESALYLGRNYRLELTGEPLAAGVRLEERLYLPGKSDPERREALKKWYKKRAAEVILPRVERIAEELGVVFAKARITDNRYRWGSCTPANNVNFNWRLIMAPTFVVDYVVVHELAHLLEPNHTERFWNIVQTCAPGTEKAKQWLRKHGQILEEEV